MRLYLAFLAVFGLIWSTRCEEYNLASHHDYDAMYQVMVDVHERCPDITRLYHLPPVDVEGFAEPPFNVPDSTAEGRKLWVLEFASNPGQHTKGIPEFKYVANMHGNEVVGREMLLKFMDIICDWHLDGDEAVQWLVRTTRIHLMTSMNPDGWEKANIADLKDGKKDWLIGRNNSNNVDLNRNFPDLDWKMFRMQGQPHHQNNHIANVAELLEKNGDKLENEVKMVIAWIAAIPFVLSANMHGGDYVSNYPYDEAVNGELHKYTASPDDRTFRFLAESYSEPHTVMGTRAAKCEMDNSNKFIENGGITNGADWYAVAGGMQDYNYLASNCMEITLELGCEKFPPPEDLPRYWSENFRSLFNFVLQAHIGVKGEIVPPTGATEPLPVVIKTTYLSRQGRIDHKIDHDITPTRDGDYFRLLVDGDYRLRAEAQYKGKSLVREAHVSVRNDQENLVEAQVVNFDFSDPDKEYELQGQGYYEDDVENYYALLQKLHGGNFQ